jgi:hypothetical protein
MTKRRIEVKLLVGGYGASPGQEREQPIKDLFREHLPSCFSVMHDRAVDIRDEHNPHLDLKIYNSSRNFAFYSGGAAILPAEALLASIEVKSTVTRDELRKSVAAREIRSCTVCRARFSATAEHGLCPICLLQGALAGGIEAPEAAVGDAVNAGWALQGS